MSPQSYIQARERRLAQVSQWKSSMRPRQAGNCSASDGTGQVCQLHIHPGSATTGGSWIAQTEPAQRTISVPTILKEAKEVALTLPRIQECFPEQVTYNRASSKSQQVTMNMRGLGVGCSPGRNFPGSTPLNQKAAHPLGRLELVIHSRPWVAAVSTQIPGLKQTSAG